jgi:WD40 repeat protein
VAFAVDGTLASSSSSETSLWRPGESKRRVVLRGYDNVMTALAFSPDGRLVAGGSAARVLYVYDTVSKTTRTTLGHTTTILQVGFSPDGRYLWSASSPAEGTLRLWTLDDASTITLVATLGGLEAGIERVIWRPDDDELLVVDTVGTLRWYPLGPAKLIRLACQLLAFQPEAPQVRDICIFIGVGPVGDGS